jgi:hypothetical protein
MDDRRSAEPPEEKVRAPANVAEVFGAPVRAGSKVVIPVSAVMRAERDEGGECNELSITGGANSPRTVPLGVFEIGPGRARFISARKPYLRAGAAFLAGLLIGRLLFRREK